MSALETGPKAREDAAKALRIMLVKAAIFIGIPLVAAIVAALTIVLR